MEKKTFLNTWKDIPAANEIQHTIEGVECTSDGISTKMAQNNVSGNLLLKDRSCLPNQNDQRHLTFSGIHGSKTNARGSGHDLPEPEVDKWHLGPGGDQAQSRQPLHHPLLQVQGHGNCPSCLFCLRRYPS